MDQNRLMKEDFGLFVFLYLFYKDLVNLKLNQRVQLYK